jgi:FtsZ-interacting cell division protein ZipA
MSDLQLGLIVVGVLVVGGVYLANLVQERRFRRRLGDAFAEDRGDVLRERASEPSARVEPQLSGAAGAHAGAGDEASLRTGDRGAADVPGGPLTEFDSLIDYVAQIDGSTPISERALDELIARTTACGKPYRIAAFNPHSGQWNDVSRAARGTCTKLRVAVQLVNRSGSITPAQLSMFCDAVRHCAEQSSAMAACPETAAALESARDLDAFCAEVDVAIGANVIAGEDGTFPGAEIRALAEGAGFRLEPDGVFRLRDGQRRILLTLDNHEPAPFLPEQIKNLATRGLTLMLDVPRVPDGLAVLDRMFETGSRLAQALGGSLVDDNRVALSAAGIARIRQQVAGIYARMEAHGIGAGTARALRLFS